MQVAAPALGVQLQSLSVRDADELEGAFAAMSRPSVMVSESLGMVISVAIVSTPFQYFPLNVSFTAPTIYSTWGMQSFSSWRE